MAVYVDPAAHPYRGMFMCHMWADTLEELLQMADWIGVDRKWIQGHPTLSLSQYRSASWVHFDIASSKRKLAVMHGAIETDKYGPVEWEANRKLVSGNETLITQGRRKVEQIKAARALRNGELK